MNDVLRERLWRHLEALPEDRLYQVLDYIEFLSSKYARGEVREPGSSFQRFGERFTDKLRQRGVGYSAIRGTLGAMETADRMVTGIAEAGKSLLREVGQGLDETTRPTQPGGSAPPPSAPPARPPSVAPPSRPASVEPPREGPEGSGDIPVDG